MINGRRGPDLLAQELRVLCTWHTLKKYEEKFGKTELAKFLERCPYVPLDQKQEAKPEKEKQDLNQKAARKLIDDNNLMFAIWIASINLAYQDRVIRELILKAYLSEIDAEFEREYSKIQFENKMKEIIHHLDKENELRRLLASYLRIAAHLRERIHHQMTHLDQIRTLLSTVLSRQENLLAVIRREVLTSVINAHLALPELKDPYYQNLIKRNIAEAHALLNDPKESISDFMESLKETRKIILEHLRDKNNAYPAELAEAYDSQLTDAEIMAKYGDEIRKESEVTRQHIHEIDKLFEELKHVDASLKEAQKNPQLSGIINIVAKLNQLSELTDQKLLKPNAVTQESFRENKDEGLDRNIKRMYPQLENAINLVNEARVELSQEMNKDPELTAAESKKTVAIQKSMNVLIHEKLMQVHDHSKRVHDEHIASSHKMRELNPQFRQEMGSEAEVRTELKDAIGLAKGKNIEAQKMTDLEMEKDIQANKMTELGNEKDMEAQKIMALENEKTTEAQNLLNLEKKKNSEAESDLIAEEKAERSSFSFDDEGDEDELGGSSPKPGGP